MENAEHLVSVSEAAKLLKLHPTLVRRYCRQRRFSGARRMGRAWLLPKVDVEVFALVLKTLRPGRPKRDRVMDELCRRHGLPNDIRVTPEEREAINENLDWFLKLTPDERMRANERSMKWTEQLRRAGRTILRTA